MDWVKLTTNYYRDLAIATGDDAQEVMFTRGMALAGETESSGFIPEALLHTLTRKPQHARRTAAALVRAHLWEKVAGGWQIENFQSIQAELEKLVEKKKRDRERKRSERAQSRATSVDTSSDSPAPRPGDRLLDHQSESKTAAAAAGDAAAAADLDPVLAVLRSKLQAHTPLRGLRFDTLTVDQAAQLVALVELHGDAPLVRVAIDTCRNPAPTHASAFLGTWAALPAPGQRLRAVKPSLCTTHQTERTPSGVCSSCASDQIASNR